MVNLLITGYGGDIGFNIAKIAKKIKFVNKVVVGDLNAKVPLTPFIDKFYQLPRVNSADYIKEIEEILAKEKICAIVPTSEPELRHINQSRQNFMHLPIMAANTKSLEIGFDKLNTNKLLENLNLPTLKTFPQNVIPEIGFPIIFKSRFGAGSKHQFLVKDKNEAKIYSKLFKDYIWQEYIDGIDNEFTCSVFKASGTKTRCIIFNRRLNQGVSTFVKIIENQVIESLCAKISKCLELDGSINIQLKVKDQIPYVFEINPRFSSSIYFRNIAGFCDFKWCLQNFLGKKISSYKPKLPVNQTLFRINDFFYR